MGFDLVIFDCDGVLIDSELLSVRADRDALAECGIELSVEEILERYTGISFAGMWPISKLATALFRATSPTVTGGICGRFSSGSCGRSLA
jgi:beta-phosphoglucomutase-like phosphatase (HAD superfamily)